MPLLKLTEKKYLILLFLFACTLSFGLNFAREKYAFHKPFLFWGEDVYRNLINDEHWYAWPARALLEGHGLHTIDINFYRLPEEMLARPDLSFKHKESSYYYFNLVPPLYPIFLAACFFLFKINTISYLIPQIIIASLSSVLIYYPAKEIFSKNIAVLSSLIVACYPDLIFWTNKIRTETLFIFFIILSFLLIIKGVNSSKRSLIYFGSIIYGLGCLTRVTLVPFIPFIFIWVFYVYKENQIKKPLVSAIMLGIICLTLLPWAVRNYVLFDKFSPLSDEASSSLVYERNITTLNTKKSIFAVAVSVIKYNSKEFFYLSGKRFIAFWSPVTPIMKPFAKVYKSITWLLLFPIAFYGMYLSVRKSEKSGLLLIFIIYYSLMHGFSLLDEGLVYRYPIQPYISIFAAYAFFYLLDSRRKPNEQ